MSLVSASWWRTRQRESPPVLRRRAGSCPIGIRDVRHRPVGGPRANRRPCRSSSAPELGQRGRTKGTGAFVRHSARRCSCRSSLRGSTASQATPRGVVTRPPPRGSLHRHTGRYLWMSRARSSSTVCAMATAPASSSSPGWSVPPYRTPMQSMRQEDAASMS